MNQVCWRTRTLVLLVIGLVLSSLGCGTDAPIPAQAPSATLQPSTEAVPSETPSVVTATATPIPVVATTTPTEPVSAAAWVNGQPVPLQDYEDQVALAADYLQKQTSFDPDTEEGQAAIAQLRHQVLSWMVDQALIDQAAAREGISVSTEKVDTEIARLVGTDSAKFEQWLKDNGLTHGAFRVQLQRELLGAALQEHIVGAEAPVVEQVHARHILVSSETEAMDILVKLSSGEDFASLASQYSQDRGTSSDGGDLGYFPRGVMPTDIEAVAFSLAPGQVSGIVTTDFGYHIIEVLEKNASMTVSDDMLPTWRQNAFVQWLDEERAAADIQVEASLQ
jgi:parvulin-like peptidyl-prolyl isomerase